MEICLARAERAGFSPLAISVDFYNARAQAGVNLNLLGSSRHVPLPPSTAPTTVSHAQYRAVLAVRSPIRVRAMSTHSDQRGRVSASAVLIS